LLSLGEQQLVAFARMLLAAPQFAFLDRPTTILGPERVARLLALLEQDAITYVTIGEGYGLQPHHDAMLVVALDGTWSWTTARPPGVI
jgi:vitamin B12/bleomycin/antimicrobial peptide transport system ATP-binding/permease protein